LLTEKLRVSDAMAKLLEGLLSLHNVDYMQGGLSIDEVYFDKANDKVTLTDWAQFSNAVHPLACFLPFSKAYYTGINYEVFAASAAHLDTLAFLWLLAHVTTAYKSIDKPSPPADRFYALQHPSQKVAAKG